MAIDLSTFWATWDVVSGNTSATNQYEFWKGMVMSNGQILANQYEFFKYHNTTRYEWFRDLQSTYPEVYDEYTFYRNTNDPNIFDMRTFYEFGAQYLNPIPVTPTPTPNVTPTMTVTPTETASPTPTPTVTMTQTPTSTSTGDPDAIAYLAAVVETGGTVNPTITLAVDNLFKNLKNAGIYSKLDVMMPMIGATKPSILINAVAPNDTSWLWTEFGTPLTYNVSGITTNSNGALRSNWLLTSLTQSTSSNSHFSIYCSVAPTTNNSFNGTLSTVTNTRFATGFYGNVPYIGQYQTGKSFAGGPSQRKGLWTANKLASDTIQFYIDDTLEVNTSDSGSNFSTGQRTAIGTLYWEGQGYANNLYPSDLYTGTFATLTIGSGMSSGQMTDLYNIITTFNTALSRA